MSPGLLCTERAVRERPWQRWPVAPRGSGKPDPALRPGRGNFHSRCYLVTRPRCHPSRKSVSVKCVGCINVPRLVNHASTWYMKMHLNLDIEKTIKKVGSFLITDVFFLVKRLLLGKVNPRWNSFCAFKACDGCVFSSFSVYDFFVLKDIVKPSTSVVLL